MSSQGEVMAMRPLSDLRFYILRHTKNVLIKS